MDTLERINKREIGRILSEAGQGPLSIADLLVKRETLQRWLDSGYCAHHRRIRVAAEIGRIEHRLQEILESCQI